MGIVLDWRKQLGFSRDPFTDEGTAKEWFVGREAERERLNLFLIKHGRFGLVSGPRGCGKSALLRWLAEELRRHGVDALLVAAAGDHAAVLEDLVASRLSLMERRITKPHAKLSAEERASFLSARIGEKRFVLLIDDAHLLAEESKGLLRSLLGSCPKLQLILAVDRLLKEYDRFGEEGLRLVLEPLATGEMQLLLERRLAAAGGDGLHPFTEEEVDLIAKEANGDLARFLSLVRDRAIELSLKAGPPPKRRNEAATKEGKKRESGLSDDQGETHPWFRIRFVKDEEDAEPMREEDLHSLFDGEKRTERKSAPTQHEQPETVDVNAVLAELMTEIEKKERKSERKR